MDLSQEVYDAAQEVIAGGPGLTDALNSFITRFLGWPFTAAPGSVRDTDGNSTEAFSGVIYTTAAHGAPNDDGAVPADSTAAVIDARERLRSGRASCRERV